MSVDVALVLKQLSESLSTEDVLAELEFLEFIDKKRRYYDEDVVRRAIHRLNSK